MPYPSQIDRNSLIETARDLIEAKGAEKVSLRVVADEFGVTPPSLYRHVKNKTALILAVNTLTTRELVAAMMAAIDDAAPIDDQLLTIVRAFRAYAHAHPICYQLAFTDMVADTIPDAEERVQLVLPLQAIFAQVAGEEKALIALRGAYAFIHGWVMLEISDQLQRGGDLRAHYEEAFLAYIAGWRN